MENIKKSTLRRIEKMEEKLEASVEAGIEYLDNKFGKTEWLKRIDERILNINNSRICVTGQLFGDYYGWIVGEKISDAKACKLGFSTSLSDIEYSVTHEDGDVSEYVVEPWEMLTRIWYSRIRSLKKVRRIAR